MSGGKSPQGNLFQQAVSADLTNGLLNLRPATLIASISLTIEENIGVQALNVIGTIVSSSTNGKVTFKFYKNGQVLQVQAYDVVGASNVPVTLFSGNIANVTELTTGDVLKLESSTPSIGAGLGFDCVGSISLLGKYI